MNSSNQSLMKLNLPRNCNKKPKFSPLIFGAINDNVTVSAQTVSETSCFPVNSPESITS